MLLLGFAENVLTISYFKLVKNIILCTPSNTCYFHGQPILL